MKTEKTKNKNKTGTIKHQSLHFPRPSANVMSSDLRSVGRSASAERVLTSTTAAAESTVLFRVNLWYEERKRVDNHKVYFAKRKSPIITLKYFDGNIISLC